MRACAPYLVLNFAKYHYETKVIKLLLYYYIHMHKLSNL